MENLEPPIRPLVDALNRTGLLQTFSSCAGHYEPDEQTLADRNFAFVKFVPAPGIDRTAVETFVSQLLLRFTRQHGRLPMQLLGYQQYVPSDERAVEMAFVLELRPFNRFDPPATKRADTDRAIGQLTQLVLRGAW